MIYVICVLFKSTGCLIHSLIFLLSSAPLASGMDDTLLLCRPFGDCGIIYRKSWSDRVSPIPCVSRRCCALLLTHGALFVLCVCVYFPTNYHDVQSTDAFIVKLRVC